MPTDLMVKERLIETEYGRYRLEYHMHEIKEDGWILYGISIRQYYNTEEKTALFDQATIRAFSDNYNDTLEFYKVLLGEEVFPVHLYSIADDWFFEKAC